MRYKDGSCNQAIKLKFLLPIRKKFHGIFAKKEKNIKITKNTALRTKIEVIITRSNASNIYIFYLNKGKY